MHLKDLLFLLSKLSFFPILPPEKFTEYVFEREFTNSARKGASFSQFPLIVLQGICSSNSCWSEGIFFSICLPYLISYK